MAAVQQNHYDNDIGEVESGGLNKEKPTTFALDDSEDIHALAERGHVATDQYVSACLVNIAITAAKNA